MNAAKRLSRSGKGKARHAVAQRSSTSVSCQHYNDVSSPNLGHCIGNEVLHSRLGTMRVCLRRLPNLLTHRLASCPQQAAQWCLQHVLHRIEAELHDAAQRAAKDLERE